MKNLKTELANLLNIIVGKTSLLEMSTDDFYPVLAQAIIDSGLMVDRESVEGIEKVRDEWCEEYRLTRDKLQQLESHVSESVLALEQLADMSDMSFVDDQEYAFHQKFVNEALSKFQAKGDVK